MGCVHQRASVGSAVRARVWRRADDDGTRTTREGDERRTGGDDICWSTTGKGCVVTEGCVGRDRMCAGTTKGKETIPIEKSRSLVLISVLYD